MAGARFAKLRVWKGNEGCQHNMLAFPEDAHMVDATQYVFAVRKSETCFQNRQMTSWLHSELWKLPSYSVKTHRIPISTHSIPLPFRMFNDTT